MRSMKNVAVFYGGRGLCPLFSSPPRGIWQLKSPHPREFAIQGKKKNANARGGAGRSWNWLMHYLRFHFFVYNLLLTSPSFIHIQFKTLKLVKLVCVISSFCKAFRQFSSRSIEIILK